MHYEVFHTESGGKRVRPAEIARDRDAIFSFHLTQEPAATERDKFNHLLEAALHASNSLGGEDIEFHFNCVKLNSGMIDAWVAYTELNCEMAN